MSFSNSITSTNSDFCNCYIALSGYIYIFNGYFTNDFLLFDTKKFKCFEEILKDNNISKDVLNYYKDIVNKLYKKGSTIINNEFFNKLTSSFDKTFQYPEIKENKINESPQKSNTEQKMDNIRNNGNKLNQLDTCKLNEDSFKLIQKQYLRLSFRMIDRDYERMEYLDNFFLRLEFNSIEINYVKKKSEYFENIIIINLVNPYDYNLWRKLSNIILKNLLVILSKKKYKFLQYKNKTVLSNLKYYESKLKKRNF